MVEHRIMPTNEGLSVMIYDTPAYGSRILFVERDGEIGRYLDRDHALTGIEIYDRADKATLFKVELDSLGICFVSY